MSDVQTIKEIYVSSVTRNGSSSKSKLAKLEEIKNSFTDTRLLWIDLIIGDLALGAEEAAKTLDLQPDPSELLSGYISSFEDRSDSLAVMIPIVRWQGSEINTTPLLIFLKKNKLTTIRDEFAETLVKLSRYSEAFLRKLPGEESFWVDRQTLLLARIIDEIIESNFNALKSIVEQAEMIQIELAMSATKRESLGVEIFELKKSVLAYLSAIWAIRDVLHSLRYGDADMISDSTETLTKFDVLLGDLDRQMSMAEHVLQVLTGAISAIQTIFQGELQTASNAMTTLLLWLTIIGTAILVPNTLATIYGIPFLPISTEEHTYSILFSIIGSSILATAMVFVYVKRWSKNKLKIF